jgi:hypothetical protein
MPALSLELLLRREVGIASWEFQVDDQAILWYGDTIELNKNSVVYACSDGARQEKSTLTTDDECMAL